ncbi:unnamed protein product [Acanthocheilonema viteae]|uniref:Uncharacterized protein n=1 Tax=Acanthocheilonema viteae TaxID=6277 RepID=A0A498SDS2_ACAVI|nr:unnamed protein product [Acanthocheilonema viteae]
MSLEGGIESLKILNEEADDSDSENSAEATLNNFRKEWKSELDSRHEEPNTSAEARSKHDQLLHDALHRHNEKSLQRTLHIRRSLHQFVPYEIVDQKFDMKLHFGDGKKRRAHCVLQILEYSFTITYLDGKISHSCLDTTDCQAYPTLFFSRVKSYAI